MKRFKFPIDLIGLDEGLYIVTAINFQSKMIR